MEDSLRDEFVRQIYTVVQSGFSRQESKELYDDVVNHINDDTLAIAVIADQIVGFAGVKVIPNLDTFFLHGIAVHGEFHGRHVGKRIMNALLTEIDLPRIAFTTQNPKMFCFLRNWTKRQYPSPKEPTVPSTEHAYSQILMSERVCDFNTSTSVAKNLYRDCLYPQIEDSRDEPVNRWFRKSLEMQEGKTKHGFLLYGDR